MPPFFSVLRHRWLKGSKGSAAAGTPGDKFTDRAGRTWRDDVYLQMLVRTNLAALTRAQQVKTLTENGRDLARISDESADSCDVCSEWGGKIVSLTGATKGYPTLAEAKAAGVFHPNCTHRLEVVTQAELDAEAGKDGGEAPKAPKSPGSENDPQQKAAKAAAKKAKKAEPEQPKSIEPEEVLPRELNAADLDEAIQKGKGLGGSTGAKLIELGGRKYVCKTAPASETNKAAHIRSEVESDNAKRALGLAVPECRLYDVGGRTVKLSVFIDGTKSLSDWWNAASEPDRKAMATRLAADADVDAILADWDGLGLAGDNVLIDKSGVPWHIDNGGSMGFRAQGGTKDSWKTGYPDELFTITSSSNNKRYIGDSRPLQMIRQAAARDWSKVLPFLSDRNREIVESRVKETVELANRAAKFADQGYTDDEQERIAYHCLELVKEGFRTECQQTIKPGTGFSNDMGDYANCRTDAKKTLKAGNFTSLPMHLKDYMTRKNLDYDAVIAQFKSQSRDSWETLSCRTKIIEMESRGINADPKSGGAGSASYGFNSGQIQNYRLAWANWQKLTDDERERYRKSQSAYKAAFQLFLENADFEGNNRQDGYVILFRTESDSAIPKVVKPGDTYTPTEMGAAESFSVHTTVSVMCGHGTIMRVPSPRILAGYFWEPHQGHGNLFLNDRENEFNADTTGLPRVYVGIVPQRPIKVSGYYPKLSVLDQKNTASGAKGAP